MANMGELSKAAREVAKSLDNADKKEPIKPKLNEDKKKEILEYLNEKSTENNLQLLSKNNVIEKFKDKEFDKEDIEGLLKQLISESRVYEDSVSFDIVYPKIHAEKIKSKLANVSDKPLATYIFIGFILIFFLSAVLDFSQYAKYNYQNIANITPQQMVNYGIMLGFSGSLIIGMVYKFLESLMPSMKKHKNKILAIVATIVAFSVIIFYPSQLNAATFIVAVIVGVHETLLNKK